MVKRRPPGEPAAGSRVTPSIPGIADLSPAPARRGDRHQPPDAHRPLRLPGRAAGRGHPGGRGAAGRPAEPGATLPDARRSWQRLSDPSLWPQERLFFELYASALRGRPGTEGFLGGIVESWVAPVTAALVKAGADERRPGPTPVSAWLWSAACCSISSPPETVPESTRRMSGSSSTCRPPPRRPGKRQTPAATALEDARPRQPGMRSRGPAVVPPARRVASRKPRRRPYQFTLCRPAAANLAIDRSAKSAIRSHVRQGGRLRTAIGASRRLARTPARSARPLADFG